MKYRRKDIPLREQVKGKATENAFQRAMELFRAEWPPWLMDIRRANEQEDRRGIDFIASTADVGDIYIEVKSSLKYAKIYMEKHANSQREICLAVISNPNETLISIFRRMRTLLSRKRQELLNGISNKFLLLLPRA